MEEEEKLSPQSEDTDAENIQQPAGEPELPEVVTEVVTASQQQEGNDGGAKAVKKKRVKNIVWNVFLVAVIALGILSLFGIVKEIDPSSGASFGEVIAGASPVYFAVFLLVMLVMIFLEVAMYCVISKTVTGRIQLATSAKCNFIGKYYDAVTPFAAGGQPMQIYYLNSKGISGGNASAMVLIKYFATMLCWIFVGGVCMIYGAAHGVLDNVSGGTVLKVAGWVGIAINLFLPLFVLFFLVFPKLMYKLTRGVVKLGAKMKIVKDVEKTTVRATKVVDDFKNSFKVMATSPLKLILLILICLGQSVLTFSMPYFVMKVFGCELDGMFITIMALNAYTTFGVSFVPTPGNSGVVEGLGALAFSVAAGATLAWSVLTWRLSVFYLYIFIGIGITVFDMIMKNKKNKSKISKTKED